MIRLVPGLLAMFGCVALALQNVEGYVRHLDTGDQAGFALGTFFLVGLFLPVAAVLLLVGAIGFAPTAPRQEGRLQRTIVVTALIAGAGFFLAYLLWMGRLAGWHSPPSGTELLIDLSCPATIVAFSANLLACALAVRPGSATPHGGGPPWLSGMILVISGIVILQIAAILLGGILHLLRTTPIQHWQVGQLLFLFGPSLAWLATLLWSAWLLHRRRKVAQG